MPMRSELVNSYFNSVMLVKDNELQEVYKDIYRNVLDNRIFNNLKMQLNELIEDDKSLISIDEFRHMFFTYFKGEQKAQGIFGKLLPFIIVWTDGNKICNEKPESDENDDYEKQVSVQKLA